MPEDEETPSTPGWLGAGVLVDGRDPGAARRAEIRETNARWQRAEADRAAQRGQERAEANRCQSGSGAATRPPEGASALSVAQIMPLGARAPRRFTGQRAEAPPVSGRW